MATATEETKRRFPVLWIVCTFLVVNSAYLLITDNWPTPPRTEPATFLFLGNVLLHLLIGLGLATYALLRFRDWWRSLKPQSGFARFIGVLAALSVAACLVTGIYLLIFANLQKQRPYLDTHVGSAAAALAFTLLYLALRVKSVAGAAARRFAPQMGVPVLVPLLVLSTMVGVQVSSTTIKNPHWAPSSNYDEGGGKGSLFWPSSAQTLQKERFFPAEYFTNSQACQKCHPDIFKQWSESAHRFSSFNNQFYRKSIEYMQEVIGPESSKWCAGCHDPAVLFTEKPGTGKPRFDFPIKDQVWPPEDFPTAHSGLACASCHSIVGVKSTMGQADVFLDYPPMHKYAISNNPVMVSLHDFLVRRAPGPHKKTFLRPFMRQQPADFCSSCHKVHLDVGVNNFRWVRGFNEYDAWQQSGVSSYGAGAFYYPVDDKTGQPDFKKCVDCHMPRIPSNDDGNKGGLVRSHRFPAANTALPFVNEMPDQMKVTTDILKTALTVDIFALRRGPKTAEPLTTRPAAPETPASLTMTGSDVSAAFVPTAGRTLADTVIAPLGGRDIAVSRGEAVDFDVVARTRKVGHVFPGGTMDAFDSWMEFTIADETGKVIYASGFLESPNGPVDKWAHFYRAFLLDGEGNYINKRNAWAFRTPLYVQGIPPGAGDTVRYRVVIPKDAGSKLTLTARVLYRKFSFFYTHFAYGGRPTMPSDPGYAKNGVLSNIGIGHSGIIPGVTTDYDNRPFQFDASTDHVSGKIKGIPDLPIIEVARNDLTIRVVDGAAPAPRPMDLKGLADADREKLRVRWNDYGIGFLRTGDLLRARYAFQQVSVVAPKWPEGYANLARTYLTEGNLEAAHTAFDKAFAMYAAKQTPMTKYFEARTRNFYAMMWKEMGDYDRALAEWTKCAAVFPKDRNVHDQMGIVYFLQSKFREAATELETTLTIDPEDLTAHYNLMRAYRGLGDEATAAKHEKLYLRFKSDETQTHIMGPYEQSHPWDNAESIVLHEHAAHPWPVGLKPPAPPPPPAPAAAPGAAPAGAPAAAPAPAGAPK